MRQPAIILITGIMAAGKSTIAQHLAERLTKSVHLRGDIYRRMIVNGRVEMDTNVTDAAYAQLRLRYRLATTTANMYCAEGFTVVYQDVILGADLQEVVDQLDPQQPRYVVVLCPSTDVVAQREAARSKVGYGEWTPESLDLDLRQNTPRIGLWLDTSALTVEETTNAILTRIEEAAL